MMKMRWVLSGSLALALAACGEHQTGKPAAAPNPPTIAAQPAPAPAADVTQPVVSGNTPTAADIAAVAALNASFDPARDPARDLETAKVEAQRGGKRIILDVGGEWCSWCHLMDGFVEGDTEVRRLRDAEYVWVKVNYSEENENTAFLSQYPKIDGYPHLFVLDAQGKLLHSQSTAELEQGKGYDRKKFLAFLKAWASPQA